MLMDQLVAQDAKAKSFEEIEFRSLQNQSNVPYSATVPNDDNFSPQFENFADESGWQADFASGFEDHDTVRIEGSDDEVEHKFASFEADFDDAKFDIMVNSLKGLASAGEGSQKSSKVAEDDFFKDFKGM